MFDMDPLREIERMRREMDRLMTNMPFMGEAETNFPLINLYDDKDSLVLLAELPGVTKDSVSINLHENTLTISGQRRVERQRNAEVLRVEQPEGEFEKVIRLPVRVKDVGIEATYEDGMLRIILPKSEEAKPKRIAIES